MDKRVNSFLENAPVWSEEMAYLRDIVLACGLDEALKWNQPCYGYQNKNIVIIGAFKKHCILGFFKGILLSDVEGLLTSPGDNSRSVKQFKFSDLQSITSLEAVIKQYIFEAIEIERQGLTIQFKYDDVLPTEELLEIFDKDTNFKIAFEALTPGRQRGYHLLFNGAKQSNTKLKRIEKYYGRIMDGKGLNDCTCGASKKLPQCDGSHKFL